MSNFSNLISIYNAILNYIQQRGLEDYDDFSWKLTRKISGEFLKGDFDVEKIIKSISTRFFKMNDLTREEFFSANFAALILRRWKEVRPLKHPISNTNKQAIVRLIQTQTQQGYYEQICVDEIDSFKEVKNISPKSVAELVPLRISEAQVKNWFAEIIDEPFTQKDWGGEPNDLFSNRVRLKGKRIPTAFLLKGPAVKGQLTISKCGKNGDQILRLVKAYSARLFIVQYIGKIHPYVVDTLEAHVAYESMKGKRLLFCVIDGVDTARIFLSHGKMKGDAGSKTNLCL